MPELRKPIICTLKYSSGPSWLPFCALQSWLKALIVTDKPSRKFLDANSHVHAFNHWVVTLKKNLFLDQEKWSRSRKKPDILVVPLSKGSEAWLSSETILSFWEFCCKVAFILGNDEINGLSLLLPRMLCNRNGAISHLQTEMGFVEDFRYSLYNWWKYIFCPIWNLLCENRN